ncbi:MAG: nucleotidyltransferase domain-containing protein [Spirochaetaceae bacterium]|jgi:predicted nucleotidyltransferase|nr:nucleotidyltransferase domain-containing protein [Spirochaetaceae bacterium]
MNNYGLNQQTWDTLQERFKKDIAIEEVILFGSRAMGNWKSGSDIDLAIKGKDFTSQKLQSLIGCLNEETSIPWKIDVLHFQDISNQELLEHILTQGIRIYSK